MLLIPTVHKPEQAGWPIRRATADDDESIGELQERLNRPSRSDSIISEYFVAVSEQRIVGCAAVRELDAVGYLYGLTVDKPWRRLGIGHALTEVRLEWLRGQNVESAFVMAMFWNIKFFKKHGFSLANRQKVKELKHLHSDFSDRWSRRSSLLFVNLASSSFAISGARSTSEHSNLEP